MAIGLASTVLIGALLTTLAIPIQQWRTGDQGLAPLMYAPVQAGGEIPRRLWIDTDAACGHSERTDPDDCFAIALLAHSKKFEIVGISTVFGNAPLEVVDRTTNELAGRLSAELGRPLLVYSGSATTLPAETRSAADRALTAALEAGPLTIVALGPLTNLAAVLDERRDLRSRVGQLIAVMGRRSGHIFHPSEGAGGGGLFGHGPVFRDFNFIMDTRAVGQIVAFNLPTTLIPYDAARGIEVTKGDLDRFAEKGDTRAWIAQHARLWLNYWRNDIGRDGFYPFDLIAAMYAIEPQQFSCAHVQVWIGEDTTLFIPFWRPTALLVDQNDRSLENAQTVGSALYCAKVSDGLKESLFQQFDSWR
jgi:inosine-uridine nucleoside N-ribohydrolase